MTIVGTEPTDLVTGTPPAGRTVERSLAEENEQARSRASLRSRLLNLSARALVPAVLLVFWQISSGLGWVDTRVLPAPLEILGAYGELIRTGDLQAALPVSLKRAGLGLLFGGTSGLVLGVVAGLWKSAERLYDAPLQMIRTIPFIAMVPLFIVWFGIGEASKVALVIGASVFPVYLNTYHGIRSIDRRLIELGRTFELDRLQAVRLILIPLAMPQILVGLRYAAGTSLLALVAAEQINTISGLGYILNNANQNQRTDIIIAGILVYAALGIVVDVLMRLLEKALLPWRLTHDGQ
jgi:sulfonate transport system permease protein